MVGSDTAMGPFRQSQRRVISGVVIAGLLAIPATSVHAANHPVSAAISAVARVENPVGTVSIDDLQNSAADSARAGIFDPVGSIADASSRNGRILLYSPSPEICINITTAENATVHYGKVLLQPVSGISTIADENKGPLIDLMTLPSGEIPSPHSTLIITVIPAGY